MILGNDSRRAEVWKHRPPRQVDLIAGNMLDALDVSLPRVEGRDDRVELVAVRSVGPIGVGRDPDDIPLPPLACPVERWLKVMSAG